MTEREEYAFLVWCRYDAQGDTNQLRIVHVSTGQNLHLDCDTLLLRITIDPDAAILRCHVRHLASGREAYIQSGAHLQAFIQSCLSQANTSDSDKGDGSAI